MKVFRGQHWLLTAFQMVFSLTHYRVRSGGVIAPFARLEVALEAPSSTNKWTSYRRARGVRICGVRAAHQRPYGSSHKTRSGGIAFARPDFRSLSPSSSRRARSNRIRLDSSPTTPREQYR